KLTSCAFRLNSPRSIASRRMTPALNATQYPNGTVIYCMERIGRDGEAQASRVNRPESSVLVRQNKKRGDQACPISPQYIPSDGSQSPVQAITSRSDHLIVSELRAHHPVD